jgi:3-hydroxyacyl-[acyl-carrier-protein] dehydratase
MMVTSLLEPEVSFTLTHRDERGATATVAVALTDPVFLGHFPGLPLLPGLFLIDFVDRTTRAWYRNGPLELTAVVRCRLLSPVLPGDVVTVELIANRPDPDLQCTALVSTTRRLAAEIRLRYRKPVAADLQGTAGPAK